MIIDQLLQRSQAGDARAIEELVQAFHTDLLRLTNSLLKDPLEAEEATQDTFLAALNGLHTYRGESTFKTWLFGIAIHTCRQRLRKLQTRRRLAQAVQTVFRISGAGPAHPEETLIRGETQTAVRRAMEALDEKHRLPVLLFYDHDLSVAEIAQALDLPKGTVLSRLHVGREKMRCTLQDDLYPERKEH
jgi:RNA polymerase sigma-70 factor, ECF subfamily